MRKKYTYYKLVMGTENIFLPGPIVDKTTLEQFRAGNCSWTKDNHKEDPDFWPCLYCGGTGKVRHIDDRDEVEGYKLAPWHNCPSCNGSAQSDKTTISAYWKEEKKKLRIQNEEKQRLKNDLIDALNKLSTEEFKIIKKTIAKNCTRPTPHDYLNIEEIKIK